MVEICIIIDDEAWKKAVRCVSKFAKDKMSYAFEHVFSKHTLTNIPKDKKLSVNLLLTNDSQITELNNNFRNKNTPTNVLTFANIDDEFFQEEIKLYPIVALGDIAISLETMQREALEQNKPLTDHFAHLLVHGVLHILGYDHIKEEDAAIMQDIEADILAQFNIPNPHAD
jgi:probable rRNA maturation factor